MELQDLGPVKTELTKGASLLDTKADKKPKIDVCSIRMKIRLT